MNKKRKKKFGEDIEEIQRSLFPMVMMIMLYEDRFIVF